jgi:hypothetical protein
MAIVAFPPDVVTLNSGAAILSRFVNLSGSGQRVRLDLAPERGSSTKNHSNI